MNSKLFSDAMSQLDSKYIEEALTYQKAKNSIWRPKRLAACLAAVLLLVFGLFQSGLLGNQTDVVTLESGSELRFTPSDTIPNPHSDIAPQLTARELTQEETAALFPGLTVTAHALFTQDGTLVGFEGTIGTIKLVLSTGELDLLDTTLAGTEETSEVHGTPVTAGYGTSGQMVLYYAAFPLGEGTVYLENAGEKEARDTVKTQLANAVETLLSNGPLSLSALEP